MGKEEIFSKLSIKDYNNQLENILEKKDFSEDVKNLLLSMLYKIENSYEDYNSVKAGTIPKKEFIEEILKIIQYNCDHIEVSKKKVNINAKKKQLEIPLNEVTMLNSIYKIRDQAFFINDEYKNIKKPLEKLLQEGNAMDKAEIIRDFDGWSWNISYSKIENKTYNLIYQNLKLILGYEFLQNWYENKDYDDSIEKFKLELKRKSNANIANTIYIEIMKIAILEYMNSNGEYRNKILSRKNDVQENLKELLDKKRYLQNIGDDKKRIAKEITRIDDIISDNELAREEFSKRNELLDEKDKIFSLSELIEILQTEREKYVTLLKKKNKLMEPMIYIQKKEELEEELKLYEEIDSYNSDEIINKIVIGIQKDFLKMFALKIKKCNSKKEIIELIYKLRYYITIPINDNKTIKQEKVLAKDINRIKKNLLTKACQMGAIEIVSKNIEENYKIVSEILDTKITKLNEINIVIKKKDGEFQVNIYDDNILDKTLYYNDIFDINLKYNKKTKLVI